MTTIHFARDGQQFGPYEEAAAEAMIADGRILPTDLVWREGMADWKPAAEVFPSLPPRAASNAPPLPSGAGAGWAAAPAGTGFAGAAAAPAGTVVPGRAASAALPRPPRLQWGWVLLIAIVTFGIFGIVWLFIQSRWIKRIDPGSNATLLFVIYLVLSVLSGILAGGTQASSGSALGSICELGAFAAFVVGIYSVRRSMLNYFNGVEPIGLRLNGVMVFFFNVLYFQHHMTRIADWQATGVLRPQ